MTVRAQAQDLADYNYIAPVDFENFELAARRCDFDNTEQDFYPDPFRPASLADLNTFAAENSDRFVNKPTADIDRNFAGHFAD